MSRLAVLKVPALVLMVCAPAAQADITAEQVWADWSTLMSSLGYQVQAQESRSGDTLSVSEIEVSANVPDGAANISIPSISFTEQSGGTVSVSLPEEMPLRYSFVPTTGEALNGEIVYSQQAPELIVSGDPGALTYDYAAQAVGMQMTGPVSDGTAQPEVMKLVAGLTNVASKVSVKTDELRHIAHQMSADGISFDVEMSDPANTGTASFSGRYDNVSFDGSMETPVNVSLDATAPDTLFQAGFAHDGTLRFGSASARFDTTSPNGNAKGEISSGAGSLRTKVSLAGLTYAAQQADVTASIQADGLPFPVGFAAESTSGNITIPLQQSDQVQEFELGVGIGGFTMSDILWSLFDPTAQLPRDPATLTLDLAGTTKVLMNILDPAQVAAQSPGTPPAELHSLNLRKLLLQVAGAELSGNGAVSFDNSNTSAFGGMPQPKGAVNISLAGVNGLLDRLTAIGLLPQEQAMGARMMMGIFAVPGDAPDTLKSVIEFNEEGHILANGQRIR